MFSHSSDKGVKMVDITSKNITVRTATAEGEIKLKKDTINLIKKNKITKGNVLTTAQISGIQAVKMTSNIIPLCHELPINKVEIDFDVKRESIRVICTVKTESKTGVEMEALTGASVALLTIWDMVKSNEKDGSGQYPDTEISQIKVTKKEK
ncbi:MAG: cyclic pyranopterin monophosphate synthase MoaC [Candidatus Methanofastidiosa archaeon]|jgi:cyclic pyranopterin phosphate synthase|nr:cyclic pyranopterin monophosphate synthase MoaC [Candidatus Methanofastidiosa archaeon]HOM96249.1 cyclic pyranopterin monophosphate synthase MoaC [Methanofastidiosum sp.]HPC81199.1 cyclic pyranopterin monophosphate synthase MoaC [Methanofastidiosum sp.]HRS25660.1 cyclic pyranopterin monophosphate synthase MoaC [Methanofastidiosum sp.]